MATTETVQITVTSSGDGIASEWKPTAQSNNAGVAGGPYKVTVATGLNVLPVPTGAMGVVLAPPSSSTAQLRLSSVSGATGLELRTGLPACLPLPTGVTGMLIDASKVEILYLHWT